MRTRRQAGHPPRATTSSYLHSAPQGVIGSGLTTPVLRNACEIFPDSSNTQVLRITVAQCESDINSSCWSPRKVHDQPWKVIVADIQTWSQNIFRKISFKDLIQIALDHPVEQVNPAQSFIEMHNRLRVQLYYYLRIYSHKRKQYTLVAEARNCYKLVVFAANAESRN